MKRCTDCKWFKVGSINKQPTCTNPHVGAYSVEYLAGLVNGVHTVEARNRWCGESAFYFEGKEKLSNTEIYLNLANQCINQIDDLMEYRWKAYTKEELRIQVLTMLEDYAKELRNVRNKNDA